uniref:RNase H type-1 domain-containing protein n=1 Tax=Cajanus cajan TaxID=3821 RepID=A0A151RVR0_CAJCA|nr:hypothetical protein KK1_031725 [Cajanus cajan]
MMGCLVKSVAINLTLEIEVVAVIRAVQLARDHGWMYLWLESDSLLVIKAFYSPSLVPWCLSVQWFNMFNSIRSMRFRFSHIYRVGNGCADSLARFGLRHHGSSW